MNTQHTVILSVLITLILTVTLGLTAGPAFWRVSTITEFLEGDVTNLSIDQYGRVALGQRTEVVYETTSPFLWTVIAGPAGELWTGSGNDGRVIKIAKDGTVSNYFDSDELEVHALAATPSGVLYVATSPNGHIYRVEPNGSARQWFNPETKYIWALAVDGVGNLFAGTGEKGAIYKITPNGEGELFYETDAAHILALTFDIQGNLLVGTETPGQVLRVDSSGQAFVALNSSYREIRALTVDESGNIYAVALNSGSSSAARPIAHAPSTNLQPSVSISTEITAFVSTSSSPDAEAEEITQPGGDGSRGAVYRITTDGVWDILWSSNDDSPYDVTLHPDGGLVVGTGNKGKIYRITGEPSKIILMTQAPAQQVTKFFRNAAGQAYFVTANPGKLLRISSERTSKGEYKSKVLDTKTASTWGTIRWAGSTPEGTSIQLFSRSGNTSIPNDTWSPWSKAYTAKSGEPIESPNARYLQWKGVLNGGLDTPTLTSVEAAYLPRNLRPVITSITVHPAGTAFLKTFSAGEPELAGLYNQKETASRTRAEVRKGPITQIKPLGRKTFRKGLRTFVWKAEDPNADRLQFDVLYRRENETTWQLLEQMLTDSIYTWQTTSVPDGSYLIKIAASDATTNPQIDALVGELESTAFSVDNSSPQINIGKLRQHGQLTILPFTVHDNHSPIQYVEYSFAANKWHHIYPIDGIPDSQVELFEISLNDGITADQITIRARDTMNNLTTIKGQ